MIFMPRLNPEFATSLDFCKKEKNPSKFVFQKLPQCNYITITCEDGDKIVVTDASRRVPSSCCSF